MRTTTLSSLLALALLAGCNATSGDTVQAEASAVASFEGWQAYGGEVSLAEPVSLELLLDDPEHYDGQSLIVEGQIDETCPKKGCWMTLSEGDRQLRVTFIDYSFFVPTEGVEGRTARFVGTFQIKETPADEVRHYLEDAGDFEAAAAVDGPEITYSLVATGVRIQ
ncbi:MAG: DUF4920 domain-containing protein [Planctomycetota bacterium]